MNGENKNNETVSAEKNSSYFDNTDMSVEELLALLKNDLMEDNKNKKKVIASQPTPNVQENVGSVVADGEDYISPEDELEQMSLIDIMEEEAAEEFSHIGAEFEDSSIDMSIIEDIVRDDSVSDSDIGDEEIAELFEKYLAPSEEENKEDFSEKLGKSVDDSEHGEADIEIRDQSDEVTDEFIKTMEESDSYDYSSEKKRKLRILSRREEKVESDIDIQKSIQDAEAFINEKEEQELLENTKLGEDSSAPASDEMDKRLQYIFGNADDVPDEEFDEILNEMEEDNGKNYTVNTVNVQDEFRSFSQKEQIFKEYKKKYKNIIVRFVLSGVLMVLLFLLENLSLFGVNMPDVLNKNVYPVIYAMVDLQLMLFAAALVYKPIVNGIVALVKVKPLPESILGVLVLFGTVYNVCTVSFGIVSKANFYNSSVAMAVFMALVYEYMNLGREIYSFNVVSSKRIKYALTEIPMEKAGLEYDAFSSYIMGDAQMLNVNKTNFVDGFYSRIKAHTRSKKIIGVIIPLVVVASLVFFVLGFAGAKTNALSSGFAISIITMLTCMPISFFLTYSYPFYCASKEAYKIDSAIIGEISLEEYSSASVISFEDRDVFPSYGVKVRSVKVYGDNRIDKVIYNAASVFSLVGGPLADVFDMATLELGKSSSAEFIEAQQNGLEAVVDGCHIYIGKDTYLADKNITPIYDDDDEMCAEDGISIMYMVCDDEVAAKMYINYAIDPDFEFILKKLYRAGMCAGIKSFDPNIDDQMLSGCINISKYPVRVLKGRGLDDLTVPDDRVDSGIVSKSSAKSLLETVTLCDKVLHVTKMNVVVKIFAMIVGIVIMTFLAVSGDISKISSLYVAAYQLFFMIPMVLITKLYL